MALNGKSSPFTEYKTIHNDYGIDETHLVLTKDYEEFRKVKNYNYGKERRNKLLELMKNGLTVPVNRKHCLLLKYDKDLQYLLKKKKVIMFYDRDHYNLKRTYLRFNNEK